MTTWYPAGQPHTPHNAPKYWAGVLNAAAASHPWQTTPTRNDGPRLIDGQPSLTRATVVTSGLADGPSGS